MVKVKENVNYITNDYAEEIAKSVEEDIKEYASDGEVQKAIAEYEKQELNLDEFKPITINDVKNTEKGLGVILPFRSFVCFNYSLVTKSVVGTPLIVPSLLSVYNTYNCSVDIKDILSAPILSDPENHIVLCLHSLNGKTLKVDEKHRYNLGKVSDLLPYEVTQKYANYLVEADKQKKRMMEIIANVLKNNAN